VPHTKAVVLLDHHTRRIHPTGLPGGFRGVAPTFILRTTFSLRFKLLGGLAVRRACYGVLRFIMEQVRVWGGKSRVRE
jgi:hypothetical protein